MLKKEDLINCFEQAKKVNAVYIGVVIETRGSKGSEVIINPRENFESKLEYYKNAYNDDMILKTYDGICITKIDYGNTFQQLECSLLQPECIV